MILGGSDFLRCQAWCYPGREDWRDEFQAKRPLQTDAEECLGPSRFLGGLGEGISLKQGSIIDYTAPLHLEKLPIGSSFLRVLPRKTKSISIFSIFKTDA